MTSKRKSRAIPNSVNNVSSKKSSLSGKAWDSLCIMPDANTYTLPFLGIVILVFYLHPFMFVLYVDLNKHKDFIIFNQKKKKIIGSRHELANRSSGF